jgi:hypothetical protein
MVASGSSASNWSEDSSIVNLAMTKGDSNFSKQKNKNYRILMVCYYLNDLQYSPTWFQKSNACFCGSGKSQEPEGGFGAAFLKSSSHVYLFSW